MTAPTRILSFGGDVRCAGEWRFEGGGFVQILIGGNVDTETALQYVDTLIGWKREELKRLAEAQKEKGPAVAEPASSEVLSGDRVSESPRPAQHTEAALKGQ